MVICIYKIILLYINGVSLGKRGRGAVSLKIFFVHYVYCFRGTLNLLWIMCSLSVVDEISLSVFV